MSQVDITKAKARISGYTTSLNNKISGAENLVDLQGEHFKMGQTKIKIDYS